jgi:hypothetical protein
MNTPDFLGCTPSDHALLERLFQHTPVLKTPIALALCEQAGHPAAGNPDAARHQLRVATRAAGTYVKRGRGQA